MRRCQPYHHFAAVYNYPDADSKMHHMFMYICMNVYYMNNYIYCMFCNLSSKNEVKNFPSHTSTQTAG